MLVYFPELGENVKFVDNKEHMEYNITKGLYCISLSIRMERTKTA